MKRNSFAGATRSVLSLPQRVVFFLQHILDLFSLRYYAKMIELNESFQNLVDLPSDSACISTYAIKNKNTKCVSFLPELFCGKCDKELSKDGLLAC
mmetsp:Transcript_65316/g.96611  ORF Transcript_65316/g.96611 Transcript_65316/m.96611 type:complete len:96 (+) Transcript_65316:1856-2143(+)